MLQRSAEGAARETVRSRVPRHVAARDRQADQRDRPRDGPLAQHREHLSHEDPSQARACEQRSAGPLRSPPPASRVNMSEAATAARVAAVPEGFSPETATEPALQAK